MHTYLLARYTTSGSERVEASCLFSVVTTNAPNPCASREFSDGAIQFGRAVVDKKLERRDGNDPNRFNIELIPREV